MPDRPSMPTEEFSEVHDPITVPPEPVIAAPTESTRSRDAPAALAMAFAGRSSAAGFRLVFLLAENNWDGFR